MDIDHHNKDKVDNLKEGFEFLAHVEVHNNSRDLLNSKKFEDTEKL